jgi:hypothetical protein
MFGKDFMLMGSDNICTALRSYRCIVCPSVSPLSLPLTKSSNLGGEECACLELVLPSFVLSQLNNLL